VEENVKTGELLIIKKYQELILYVYGLLGKFPQQEKMVLGAEIKNCLFKGFTLLLKAKKAYSKREKLNYLGEVDVNLSCLKVYVRIAYKKKYIKQRNYRAWSYKITNIGNMLGGWINACHKR